MAVSVPTPSQLREVAGEVGLDLSDTDVTSFIELMRSSIAAYAFEQSGDWMKV
jgi:amidase